MPNARQEERTKALETKILAWLPYGEPSAAGWTIKRIAKAANVSPAVASRILARLVEAKRVRVAWGILDLDVKTATARGGGHLQAFRVRRYTIAGGGTRTRTPDPGLDALAQRMTQPRRPRR